MFARRLETRYRKKAETSTRRIQDHELEAAKAEAQFQEEGSELGREDLVSHKELQEHLAETSRLLRMIHLGRVKGFTEKAAYYARLKTKYAEAAAHPWRSIPPDRPPP